MQSINFDSGYKEYAVNGDESNVIRINITDFNIIKRYNEAMPKLQTMAQRYAANKDSFSTNELSIIDSEIRSVVDEIFDADVSSHAFGNAHPLSLLDSGKFLVESFMDAFMPIIQADFDKSGNALANRPDLAKAEKYLKNNQIEKIDLSALTPVEREKILSELLK